MIKLETSVVQTIYQALDGTQFRFENECLAYEARQRAKDLHCFTIKVDGVNRFFYQVDTKEDLSYICRAFDSSNYTCYFKEHEAAGDYDAFIGGLIGFGYRDNDCYEDDHFVTSVETFKEEMNSYITKYENLKRTLEELVHDNTER